MTVTSQHRSGQNIVSDAHGRIAQQHVVLRVVALGEVALSSSAESSAYLAPNCPHIVCPTGMPVRMEPMLLRNGPICGEATFGACIEKPQARSIWPMTASALPLGWVRSRRGSAAMNGFGASVVPACDKSIR